MRIPKVILPLLAVVGLGFAGTAVTACHAEGHAQVAVNSDNSASATVATPPPPSSTPEAATTPPPPPPPPPRKITLKGVGMKSATQIDLPGAVDFKTGSAKLDMTKNTTGFLTQVKTIMTSNPDINLLSVEGNTDNEGEDKGFDNTKLSQDRAQAVVDYLTKNGIDATRLKAVGMGSKNPLCPNDSAEHKACNRRVEVHVRKFGGQDVQSDSSGGGGAAPAGTSTAATATSSAPATSGSAVGGAKPKTK